MFEYWREGIILILFGFIVFIPFVGGLLYTITASISGGCNFGKIKLAQLENEKVQLMTEFAKASQKQGENNGKE